MAYLDGSLFDHNGIKGHIAGETREIKYHVNGAWTDIRVNGVKVFSRVPSNNDWFDEKHKAIYNTIAALESALNDAIPD